MRKTICTCDICNKETSKFGRELTAGPRLIQMCEECSDKYSKEYAEKEKKLEEINASSKKMMLEIEDAFKDKWVVGRGTLKGSSPTTEKSTPTNNDIRVDFSDLRQLLDKIFFDYGRKDK